MGSDHEIMEWEVDMEKQEQAAGTQVIGWNLAAMSQEDKEQAEELCRKQARGRAYLGVKGIGDDVESEAEWCQEELGKVLDATANNIRICGRSKTWWNGETKERRSQLGREQRRRHRSVTTAQGKAEVQKSIWRAKDRMSNDYLNNLWGDEASRAANFGNPRAGETMEALTNRDGTHTNTITEKQEMVRRETFPPNEDDVYIELLLTGQA
jgi:hypothetical protein